MEVGRILGEVADEEEALGDGCDSHEGLGHRLGGSELELDSTARAKIRRRPGASHQRAPSSALAALSGSSTYTEARRVGATHPT